MRFFAFLSSLILSAQFVSADVSVTCDTGPVVLEFGKSNWSIFLCDDEKTLIFVSTETSPAHPFYFRMTPGVDGQYHLFGEGTGAREYTDAAYQELSGLTHDEHLMLVQEVSDLAQASQE